MRSLLFVALVFALAACGPDPLLGTYNFTISGLDTTTAPTNGTTTPSGTGTMAVTNDAAGDFVITVSQSDNNPCVLDGTRGTGAGRTIAIKTPQTCTFRSGAGSVTATMTSGTATLTDTTLSLVVAYSFAGTTLGINYAGTGSRTYAGPKL